MRVSRTRITSLERRIWRRGLRGPAGAGVSDSFESCLWYCDFLGSLARQGHAVLARQALLGGDYELLDRDSFAPNPVRVLVQRVRTRGGLLC